ncbi:hypothetical protein CQJ94_18395 [Glycomyces fuscus]|nr:hypothetical protein CQJ94_18395 [Glycomyces fuscus]
MRYLFLIASALWLLARASAHAVRRRAARVRRYAAAPPAPRPHVVTGPIPLVLPSQTTGAAAPPLPAPKALPWHGPAPAPVAVDVLRADRSRLGVPVPSGPPALPAPLLSRQERYSGRHRAAVAA